MMDTWCELVGVVSGVELLLEIYPCQPVVTETRMLFGFIDSSLARLTYT